MSERYEQIVRREMGLERRLRRLEIQERLKADQHAFAHACSMFLALPGLRGFWPMSAFDGSGSALDQSGNGQTLTVADDAAYNYDNLAPYVDFPGTADYLFRADEATLDITGTETYVIAANRGLTIGGWFYIETLGDVGLIGKWRESDNERSYQLRTDVPSNDVLMRISLDGTAVTLVQSTDEIVVDTWYFIVGRFDPSTGLKLYIGDLVYNNAAAIPASIHSGASRFEIGTFNNGTADLDGRASMCFLCATLLPDDTVSALYQQSRALYGV